MLGPLDVQKQIKLCKLMLKNDAALVSVRLSQDFFIQSMIQRKYSFADKIASIGEGI